MHHAVPCRAGPPLASKSAGSGWLEQLQSSGNVDDATALAAAAELSLRSNHPVSKAVAACGQAAGRRLPEVDILDFKLVPGTGTLMFYTV